MLVRIMCTTRGWRRSYKQQTVIDSDSDRNNSRAFRAGEADDGDDDEASGMFWGQEGGIIDNTTAGIKVLVGGDWMFSGQEEGRGQ